MKVALPLQPQRLMRGFQWRYLLLLPLASAIVHLIATFMAMSDTRHSAFALLADKLPLNKMTVLPPVTPGQQPLPYLSSDARYSMCRFSTAKGPMTVSSVLPDIGWTIGIYRPDGTTAYFAAAAAGHPTSISLTIVPGEDRFLGLSQQAIGKAAPQQAPQLIVSAREGLVVVRAPDKGAAYSQGDDAALSRSSCVASSF